MKRILLMSALLVALAATAKTSTPAGWIDDYDTALKRAADEEKLIVANFSGSDWCGWCKRLDSEVFNTYDFRKGATNRYVLLMVDSPRDRSLLSPKAREQNPKLVEKYGIRGFPTVLILDAKGKTVNELGYRRGGPENYLKALEAAIKK